MNFRKPNKPGKYYQGYYTLMNKQKYVGNPQKVTYRFENGSFILCNTVI